MKTKLFSFALIVVELLCTFNSLHAQTRYWVGGTDVNWANTANWATTSGGTPPASAPIGGQIAVFDNFSGGVPTFTTGVPSGSGLTIQCQGGNGVNLNMPGLQCNIALYNGSTIDFVVPTTIPLFTVYGGSILNFGNAITTTLNAAAGSGTLNWGGNVTNVNLTGMCTLNYSSGNIANLSVSAGQFVIPLGQTVTMTNIGPSSIALNSPGILTVNGTLTCAALVTVNVSGSLGFSIASGGVFNINGTCNNSAFIVNDGTMNVRLTGTLNNTGTITTNGPFNVSNVGFNATLNNTGTLTVNGNGGQLNLLTGSTYSGAGALTIQGGMPTGAVLQLFGNANYASATTPNYVAGIVRPSLQYTGFLGRAVGAELPVGTNIRANVSFGTSGAGYVELAASSTYLFEAELRITASGRLRLNTNTVVNILNTGSYNALPGSLIRGNNTASIIQNGGGLGGCIRFETGYEVLNQLDVDGAAAIFAFDGNLSLAGQMQVRNGGTLSVGSCGGTTRLTLNNPTNTLTNAGSELHIYPTGTLEINGPSTINAGTGAAMTYDPGSELLYSGSGIFTSGLELPGTMPGRVTVNKLAGSNLNLPNQAQIFNGLVTVQTGGLNLRTNTVSTQFTVGGCQVNSSLLAGGASGPVVGGNFVSINAGAALVYIPQITSNWTGVPTYVAGAPSGSLVYTSAAAMPNRTTGQEFPNTMNGDVTINIQSTGDLTFTASKIINGSFGITGAGTPQAVNIGTGNTLDLVGNFTHSISAQGVLNVGVGGTGGARLIIRPSATLTNSGTINIPNGVLGNNNTVVRDGLSAISGAGTFVYGASFTGLRYQGASDVTAGIEFPAVNGPTDVDIAKMPATHTVTLTAPRSLPLTGILNLPSGKLNVSAGGFTVNNPTAASAVTHTANQGWVVGELTRAIAGGVGTYSYPVGTATDYLGFTITGNAAALGTLAALANPSAGGKTATGGLTTPFASESFRLQSSVNLSAVSLNMNRSAPAFTAFSRIAEAPASGGPYSSFAVGSFTATNITTPAAVTTFTALTPKYIAFAGIPSTYYYNAGVPSLIGSWGANVGGGGTNPPDMITSGLTFVIESGDVASFMANFTVSPGVTFQIDNGGTLEMNGDVNLLNGGAGAAVTYQGPTALLRYVGGTGNFPGFEFPNAMPGAVTINRAAASTFAFLTPKTVSGVVTISNGQVFTNTQPHFFNATPTSLVVTGGLLSITGTTTVNGGVNLSGGRIGLGGNLSFAAANTLAVTGTGILELAGSSWQIATPGQVTYAAGTTLEFTGGWNNPGGVNLNTLPSPMDGNILITNGTPISTFARTINGNINIVSGSLTANPASNITLSGGGTVTTAGANRIQMLSNSGLIYERSTIDGAWFTGNAVANININNLSGVTLTNPLTVSQNFNFAQGIFTTSTTAMLSVSGTITNGNPTRYINGPVRIDFQFPSPPQTKDIPVGRGSSYLPVTLQNIAPNMPPPTFEVEAYNYHCNGTAVTRPLGNEHWRVQTLSGSFASGNIILGTMSPIATDSRIGYAGAPGFRDGTYLLFPMGTVTLGSPNTILNALPGSPNDFLVIAGAAPTTFYYQSGDANLTSSWNSNIGGTGSIPVSFGISGFTFLVPNARNATFLTTTNPFGNGTLLQADPGGAITIPNGQTLVMNGQLRIANGARLTLQGNGRVNATSPIQYVDASSVLEYNAPANRITTTTEFPHLMPARLEINSGSIRLDADKRLQSSFLLNNGSLDFSSANRLRLSGALTFQGMTTSLISDTSDTLIIDSIGTITGSVGISQLARLTMQRGGQTLGLSGTLRIGTQLGLFGGNVRPRSGDAVILQNPADTALLGGNAASYVVGPLVRRLRPNLSAMNPSTYPYPIGTAIRFLGARLENSTTGSMGADVGIEPFGAGSGGSVAPGITGAVSISEYWRVVNVGGEFAGGNVSVTRSSPLVLASNALGTSPTQAGAYTSLGGGIVPTPFGNALQGGSAQHGGLPFAAVNTERFYAVLGVVPNAPRIFGFSPTFGGNGTTIRVTGANFSTIQAVAIGGVPVFSFTLLGDSVLTATILNGVSGAVQISGTAGGAASDSVFRFIPPPSIGMVTPNPAGIGSTITIPGTNLRETNYLTIGGVEIPISPMNIQPDGSLQVVIPPNVTFGTIVLGTPGGSIEDTTALVLVPRPVILSVSPQVASTGEILTLLGQNFQNVRFVRLGGGASRTNLTNAVFTVNSPTRISVIIPAQTRRSLTAATLALEKNSSEANAINPDIVPITVIAAGGTATTNTTDVQQFFYRSIAPTMGGGMGGNENLLRQVRVDAILDNIAALGERVRVTGANMEFIVGIEISTSLGTMTTASWQVTSSGQISIIVPQTGLLNGTNASASSIATTIRFIGAYNQITVSNAFVAAARPVVARVLPTNAEVGETIRLEGENLRLAQSITIGDVPAPFTLNPDGTITVRIPSVRSTDGTVTPAAGALVVRGVGGSVSNPTQTLINASYLSGQPVITSFSPSTGAGGSVIVVTGANFTAITGVLVGGVPVQDFIVNSGNRLTLILSTQASARAEGSISLVTPLGVVESRQSFRFTQSLEGDIVRLAQALNISVDAVRARVVEEQNQLVSVNLSGLRLTGGIVPDVLRSFSRLRVLNLSNTGLVGNIQRALPAWIQGLKELEEIDVSFNELEGEIASEPFCAYPNLKRLNASNNRLAGIIPLCLTTREKLQVLQLSNNRFEGSIPAGLGTLPNLRVLNLANNRLTGNLPSSFGQTNANKTSNSRAYDAQTLEVLDMSINELTGTIPAEWSAMASLKTLNLSRNRLSGELSPSLAGMTAMEHLNVSENAFTGAFPVGFGNARNLRVVRLAKNAFTSIPNMGDARRLDTVDVQNNRLDFGSLEGYARYRTISSVQALLAPQDSVGVGTAQEVRVGERVRFFASGSATPLGGTRNRYEWRKNGVPLDTASDRSVIVVNAGTELRILATRGSDAGVYSCRITSDTLIGIELRSRAQSLAVTNASAGAAVSAVQVLLQQPTNESENISVRPRLQWRGVRGMDSYEVQIASDEMFRTVLERQIVPHVVVVTNNVLQESLQEARVQTALGRGERLYWRVRALSSAVQTLWSATWSFRVVPLGVDVAVGTLDAGKASIGDASTAQSVAVNVGNDAVEIEDISVQASDTARFRLKTRLAQGKTTTLAAGGELPIEVVFSPKEQGFVRGTIEMRYRDGQGTLRTVRFQAIARGSGAALLVQPVVFDTIRIGRGTQRSAELINRSSGEVKIVRMRVLAGSLQTVASTTAPRSSVYEVLGAITPAEPVLVASGDTLPKSLRAFPREIGTQRGVLEVLVASRDAVIETSAQGEISVRPSSARAGEWLDTVRVEVRGEARLPQNTDAVLRVGIRTQQDSVAPGGTTRLEVYALEGSNKAAILRAGLPVLRGTVSYGRQVLRLGAANLNGARAFRETTGTSRVERVQIPRTSWDGRSEVLFQCEVQAVAGDTDRTALVVENFVWGDGNPSTRAAWEAQVFVEEPEAGVFTARACVAGGKRLVTSAKATALAVVRPNPVKDVAEIAVTLREDGPMLLEVVSLRGEVVAVLAEGEYAAGEQTFVFAAKNLPSGSYQVRLTTRYERKSVPVMVVR